MDAEISVRWEAPNVLVLKLSGYLSLGAAAFVRGALNRALNGSAKLEVFCDGEYLNAWDSDTRKELSEALRKLRERGGNASILVRSKLVGTALWAFGIARGLPLRVFSDRSAFLEALALKSSGEGLREGAA